MTPGYFPASCYISGANAVTPDNCNASPAPATFNPATFDWTNNSFQVTADDGGGNEIRYAIHRLCGVAGSLSAANQACVYSSSVSNPCHEAGESCPTTSVMPYYRITTRVRGPRGTVAYTQMTMF